MPRPERAAPAASARPTLRDVAREAGLSVTQVSRALNDHDDVALATKELARLVADRLGYLPNLEARRLRDPMARTDRIGVVLPAESLRFNDPTFGDLLTSMMTHAGAHDRQLNLWTGPSDATETAPYERAIRNRRVDGFVVVRTRNVDARIEFLAGQAFPFVTLGRPASSTGYAAIQLAGEGLAAAVGHLVDLGHRRIACLAEPAGFAMATERLQALESAMASHGLAEDSTVVEAGFHEDSGFEATLDLVSGPNRPSAIIALNDLLAIGALRAAASFGLAVPADLSVVGFDDIAAAELVTPALTTVRFDRDLVGSLIVDELIAAVDAGGPHHRDHLVPTELVVRESTGPAPATE